MRQVVSFVVALSCVAGGISAVGAPPEIPLWPNGMPESVIPADPPEKVEKGADGIGMHLRAGATGPTDWQQRAIDWLRLREYAATP